MKSLKYLFVGCALLFSCQKDTLETSEQEQNVIDNSTFVQRSYSINDLPFEEESLKRLLKSALKEKPKQGELPMAEYRTEVEISLGNEVIENTHNQTTTYSIALNEKEISDDYFKNIVIEKSVDKQAVYLITYYPTEAYRKAVEEGFVDIPYEDHIG